MASAPRARKAELRKALDDLYDRFNRRDPAGSDPVEFLYRYDELRDREVVGLIASSLAFGTVKQIMRSVETVVEAMGSSPVGYLAGNSPATIRRSLSDFRHRWIDGGAMAGLLLGIRRVLERRGSLESCFAAGYDKENGDAAAALEHFVDALSGGTGSCGRLLPAPCRKSACKRLFLYLRWMVRRDEIDPGGWRIMPPSKLIVPLDVHMFRISSALGFTERRQADLAAAREITGAFREISADDPVKYDYALTRLGMCRGEGRDELLERLGIRDYGRSSCRN